MEVTPYLVFSGTCQQALDFYKQALGVDIKNTMTFENSPKPVKEEDKNKIMHATFSLGKTTLMASDGIPGQPPELGTNIHLSLNFTDVADMDKKFNALVEGGKTTMPLQDTFWGARFGMLTDKFGINWMFNCELKK